MKIIVGLGNPGRRYESTPHNVGFDVVDALARREALIFKENARFHAWIAEGMIEQTPIMFVKPLTFMNLSGDAVAPLVRQREMTDEDLLIVTDDINLPIGKLRIRTHGSHGGHNGLRSISQRLGTDQYHRLRVGIQPEFSVGDLAQYVLGSLAPLEREMLKEMLGHAADAVECWIRQDASVVAERFNGKRWFAPVR